MYQLIHTDLSDKQLQNKYSRMDLSPINFSEECPYDIKIMKADHNMSCNLL